MENKVVLTLWNEEEGDEEEVEVPARFEVCPRCEGHGTHLHEAIGSHAYTQEEFDDAFSDEEERAAYFQRGGRYDVCCTECKGLRVVAEADLDRCSPELRQQVEAYQARLARAQRERAYERRYGY